MMIVKKIFFLLLWAVVLLSLAQPIYAQELCPSSFANLCKIRFENGGPVGAVLITMIIIAIFTCLVFMVIGGIKWITSGGDEAKIKAARSTIVAALVGLVIAVCAFGITNVVLTFFTGQGVKSLKVPKLIP